MVLNINFKNCLYNLELDKHAVIFGKSNSLKAEFINYLYESLQKNKNILIDGNNPDLSEYNILLIDEDSDFSKEFKFTKTNVLKQLIYDDVLSKINSDKIIDYANEIFDIIDDKVNRLLDRKVNTKSNESISFHIEIPDIYSIIDKFTNIYIDDLLLNSNNITKAMKRKLLYKLYFLDINNQKDRNHIIIINNFDAYLSSDEIINFLEEINNLSCNTCHFILTSSSNIFEYINLEKFNIYKLNNKLISLKNIDLAIKKFIIKREYKNLEESFESFYEKSEKLITSDEILSAKNQLLNCYSVVISKALNCNSIKIVKEKPKNIKEDYILCTDENLKLLFEEIISYFID